MTAHGGSHEILGPWLVSGGLLLCFASTVVVGICPSLYSSSGTVHREKEEMGLERLHRACWLLWVPMGFTLCQEAQIDSFHLAVL